jgi:hypothetical protein
LKLTTTRLRLLYLFSLRMPSFVVEIPEIIGLNLF